MSPAWPSPTGGSILQLSLHDIVRDSDGQLEGDGDLLRVLRELERLLLEIERFASDFAVKKATGNLPQFFEISLM